MKIYYALLRFQWWSKTLTWEPTMYTTLNFLGFVCKGLLLETAPGSPGLLSGWDFCACSLCGFPLGSMVPPTSQNMPVSGMAMLNSFECFDTNFSFLGCSQGILCRKKKIFFSL